MPAPRQLLSGSEPVGRRLRYLEPADGREQLRVGLLLRRPPKAELPSLQELCARPYRSLEERDRIRREGVAAPRDIETVRAFAREYELDFIDCDEVQRVVTLAGPVERCARAFGVEMMVAEHAVHGRHRTHLGSVQLPADLAACVDGVFGLDERRIGRRAARSSLSMQVVPMLPTYLAELYDFPKGDGAGQSIAILELGGGYLEGSMRDYFARLGIDYPDLHDAGVLGSFNEPGRNARYDAEVCLDIQILASLVPAARFTTYFAPNTGQGFLLGLRAAVYGGHSVVSISWSESEEELTPMIVSAMEQTLHEAAAMGVTVCVASGDLGAGGELFPSLPEPFYPGTSPFALAVGGTSPLFHAGIYYGEIAWNEGKLASGGGISALFDCPPYQLDAAACTPSIRPGVGFGRGLPDVSAMSYGFETWRGATVGYWVNTNGTWQALGGTSASTPVWAALTTRLNDHVGFPLGFLQPYLYRLRPQDAAFLDLAFGHNANVYSVLGGYAARPGWDACTGLGRPRGRDLLAAIRRQLPARPRA